MDKKDYEMDLANRALDELRDKGFKSFEEKQRHEQLKRALQDYDRYLSNPYG